METFPKSKDAVSRALPHLHVALEHLLKSWDALREFEKAIDQEITTEDLRKLAGDIHLPDDVRGSINPRIVRAWLKKIDTSYGDA